MSVRGTVMRCALSAGTWLALAVICLAAAPQVEGSEPTLSVRARAADVLNIERGTADYFDIRVDGWTTDADLEVLAKAFKQDGDSGLVRALAAQDAIGWMAYDPRGGGGAGRNPAKAAVRFAREFVSDDVREVILVTEDHVGYGGFPRVESGARLEPEMLSVVVLKLSRTGAGGWGGEGRLFVGTTVDAVPETGKVELSDAVAETIALLDVRPR